MKMGRFWFGVRMTAAIAVIAAAVFSCEKPPAMPPSKGLTLSENKTVAFDETSTSLRITASVDWQLSVDSGSNWLSPNATRGAAQSSTTVTFTFSKNDTGEARTGGVTITASGEEEPYHFTVTQNSSNTLSGVNKWIYDELCGWYYWNDAVKSSTPPSNSLAYDNFLEATIDGLPWRVVQDTSNGENPPTIDGTYLYRNGTIAEPLERDNIYSYIERYPAGTRTAKGASESNASTFGFGFEPFYLSNTSPKQYMCLVTWVRDESPADKAGLKRGVWIAKYNGSEMDQSVTEQFWSRLHQSQAEGTMTLTDEKGKAYELTATDMKVSPVIHYEVMESPRGKKVAYLFYNGFERGDNGEFDKELRDVFGGFKSAGAQEIVIDLRYNPGGYVESCRILTSLAADVNDRQVFIKMLRNGNINAVWPRVANPQIQYFLNEPNTLDMKTVYVLATGDSASASEMVINALRGVDGLKVVHIGTKTNGKNVGMDLRETSIDGYDYEMWPITFKILNAKDFTDYADGLEPDHYVEEFWDVIHSGTGVIHELGDPNERLLKAALTLIDGGTVRPDTRAPATTRATGTKQPMKGQMYRDHRRGGAKYVPQTEQ